MQKLTLLFIYGNDEERKLRYRVTDDMPVGVMLEKLIGFQFVIDSSDPTTFRVMHKGAEISDLTKTFEDLNIADGDEIFIMPTVFDPIPPLPENDVPIKKQSRERTPSKRRYPDAEYMPKKEPVRKPGSSYSPRRRPERTSSQVSPSGKSTSAPRQSSVPKRDEKGSSVQTTTPRQGEKKVSENAPIPFKPKSRNYHRNYKKPSAPKKPS